MNNKIKPVQTILQVPDRSPLAVVEAIKPYIKNKIVCELGSAAGDISLEMAKYAKHVIGVEIDKEQVKISRKRGLYTIRGDVTTFTPPENLVKLPICTITGSLPCNGCPTKEEYFIPGTEPKNHCFSEHLAKLDDKNSTPN